MTVPQDYTQASQRFERFLVEARDALGHATTHQTYTTVEAVLVVFRRRLSVRDALLFADALPAVLRAVFVSDWDPEAPVRAFTDRACLTREAQDFRRDHAFVPDDAIAVVGRLLRTHVDGARFARVLQALPPSARDYWTPA